MLVNMVLDTLKDTVKLLPFLFLTYLVMEYLEYKTGDKSHRIIGKIDKFGPLFGAVVGVFPQCGFSAAASNLFSGGVITMGTLVSIFLSTSDEMLPILLAKAVKMTMIFKILFIKVGIGAVTGFLIDLIFQNLKAGDGKNKDIHDLCTHEQCHCEDGILKSALNHTLRIGVFIFLFSFGIGMLIKTVGERTIEEFLLNQSIFGVFLTGIIGLIPNCAASVAITELYLQGLLGTGQMMSGLLVGAGVGILLLFRSNQNLKENLKITAILYGVGVLWGLLIEVTKVVF
ncbi:MAG: arsenic efflux protein [Lachnospiraceae bacterium]|nr:arsenic efflux protein [Lachnospiraceae bacterium]